MRQPALRLYADELIVDNFAGGGGASLGIEQALGRSPDIAINHDPDAIAMHKANHPGTKHYCEDVWKVNPVEVCAGRPVGLAWFSPDCKHFSKAKGGKPVNKNIRGLAWIVVKWAKLVRPRVIILENVEEFADWGPLGADGKPCPLRKGFTFRRWLGCLRNAGYDIDFRELAACDYGAPTTRKRLFLVARRDGLDIIWPEPTHGRGLLPYRTAAECIDWDIPCPSIFDRKKPLAANTLRRIANGIKRFVLENPEPFIVGIDNKSNGGRDVWPASDPLRTVTVENRFAVAVPYLVPTTHQGDGRTYDLFEPMRTITGAHRGEQALIAPALVRTAHGERDRNGKKRGRGEHAVTDPMPTVTASNDFAMMSATLIQTGYGERKGQKPRVPGLHKPLGTVVAGGQKHALVAAFLAKHFGGAVGTKVTNPLPTITARGTQTQVVTSNLVKLYGTCKDGQDVRKPMPTVTSTGNHIGEVRAFLTQFYGEGGGQIAPVDAPMRTIPTRDRIALVTVHGEQYAIVDIGMRMLTPRELFRAQGFTDSYIIDPPCNGRPLTKTAQVRMCGNSVSPYHAKAMAKAQFEEQAVEVVA